MKFILPDLPFDFDALEPYIDMKTMHIHHDKHHQGYTDKLNKAVEDTDLEGKSIEQILKKISKYSADVRNNGGGFYNHSLFWQILSPDNGSHPEGGSAIEQHITRKFGHFDNFKSEFKKAATGQFGSGWAWLCVDVKMGDIFITSTPNQDNPLMDVADFQGIPILGLDVWEHAYYLKYQNRRPDYVDAFFEIINWEAVNHRLEAARTEVAMEQAAI
ncbi:MAG: superoxide dismutase [Saprospiraceae bacterium]|nr:superoxide dismutase [Saprospiraceae bacterium]